MAAQTNGSSGPAGGITKMEGVRQALAKLGKNAKPLAIQTYLKAQFAIDMSTDNISNYKSEILRKKAGKRKPAVMKSVANSPAAPKAAPAVAGAVIDLKDIQTVKELIGRIGAVGLKSLVELLSK